jgi:ADP-ribosyl-[dinitrogen reductase] hydrolase
MEKQISVYERYAGSIIGLATGDALGTTLEFKKPGMFENITDVIGGGPFHLKPGQWTDDTSMALCLAESLILNKGFDPVDQMNRYNKWYQTGYLSSTGECFDIGGTVQDALEAFSKTGNHYSGSKDQYSAGNGSIMRLAPIPLFYANHPEDAIRFAEKSSMTTHGTQACLDACRYMSGIIVGALMGKAKEELLSTCFSPVDNYWENYPFLSSIEEVAKGSFKKKQPPDIVGSGYVLQSLEAALWSFYRSNNFREGALLAVNLGNDADTTGAIYGQIAGAYYGLTDIPVSWVNCIYMQSYLMKVALKLIPQ